MGCPDELAKASEVLAKAGFPVAYDPSGSVVSVFRVEESPLVYAFQARCSEEGVEVRAIIKGFEPALQLLEPEERAGLLLSLLRLAWEKRVCMYLLDGSLAMEPRVSGNVIEAVGEGFASTVNVAGWLAEMLSEDYGDEAGKGGGEEEEARGRVPGGG